MTTATATITDKVRNTFDFTIDRFPLSGPDNMKTSVYGLFRSDNQEHVGKVVSKDYVPHTTDDVLTLVDAASEAFDGTQSVDCFFKHGHHVSVSPSADYRREIYGQSDNVFPRIVLKGSYNGRGFSAHMGYYRDLCQNLAMLSQVEGASVSIRHSSNLRSRMDELVQTFSVLKESWASLTDVIQHLQSREVRMAEFMDQVYGSPEDDASKKKVTTHKNRTKDIWNRLNAERFRSGRPVMDGDRVSAWEAFNAVQGYVQHKKQGDIFARAMVASGDAHVKRAESLVMALTV